MTRPGRVANAVAFLVALAFFIRILAIISEPPPPPLAQGQGIVQRVEATPVASHHFRGAFIGSEPEEPVEP